jgi:hypothetical protein
VVSSQFRETLSKITRAKCTGGVAQVVECLLYKYKPRVQTHVLLRKRERETDRDRERERERERERDKGRVVRVHAFFFSFIHWIFE